MKDKSQVERSVPEVRFERREPDVRVPNVRVERAVSKVRFERSTRRPGQASTAQRRKQAQPDGEALPNQLAIYQ